MSSLADFEKKFLLDLARRVITAAVEQRASLALPLSLAAALGSAGPLEVGTDGLPALLSPAGAFVTLRLGARLRGCIGQLPGPDSLLHVVSYCAKAAALEDPRFAPVKPEDVADIDIEISVLSPLEDILVADVSPGKHGLVVSRGFHRGVLLPQVATQFNWNAERFLEETCVKAGLEPSAWKDPQTCIQAFSADVFSEADLKLPLQDPSIRFRRNRPGTLPAT